MGGRSLRVEPLEDRWLLAVFTVTNLMDAPVNAPGDAPGTLRQALFNANNSAGADTIEFAAGLNGTLTLTNDQLVIFDDLTITGLGSELVTIDALGGSRIFNVDDFDTENLIDVTISGLTLTDGHDLGGGGAIFSHEKLHVTDSVVTGNEAQWGGGLYNSNYGEMTLLRTTVSGNTAISPGPPTLGSGGGVYNSGGAAQIIESTISGNMAPAAAGIRNANGGNLEVVDSTISGNLAGFGGGGLRNDGSYASIFNSSISGNTAAYGAGINNAYDGTLIVEHSTISGNMAGNSGGGIRSADGDVSILNSTLNGNEASYGGGLYVATFQSTPTIVRNSTISNNTAPQGGGGIYNFLGHTIIEFSTITENTSDDSLGSGVTAWGDAVLTLTEVYSSIIAGNHHTDVAVAGEPNTFQSNGYNLIGMGDAGSVFTAAGDQTGVNDPQLGLLADNGGPTLTHALLPDSPAIDAGDPTAVAGENDVPRYDQRGAPFDRVRDGDIAEDIAIDIGAFEVQQFDPGPELPGDYNGDGVVDAADYTVWRDTLGSTTDLRANGDDSNNVIDQDDYDVWVAHFGETLDDGSASASAIAGDLQSPEPEDDSAAASTMDAAFASLYNSTVASEAGRATGFKPPLPPVRDQALLLLSTLLPDSEGDPADDSFALDYEGEDASTESNELEAAISSDLAPDWP